MAALRFVDLFAGLGGFHRALSEAGHTCIFASELDDTLREVYQQNFPGSSEYLVGDIRHNKDKIKDHDILCAGFPCQPFSKSGKQQGVLDKSRGTLFHDILEIVEAHWPPYVLLENVGNFERHDGGNTWRTVRDSLQALGYHVRGTLHKTSGGHGLISPHHFGHPHHRERFFAVASLSPLPEDPFPKPSTTGPSDLMSIVLPEEALTKQELVETRLSPQQKRCIDHWNVFLQALPEDLEPPGSPLWGDEFGATYLYQKKTPHKASPQELRQSMWRHRFPKYTRKAKMMEYLPRYARMEQHNFPDWKVDFIAKSRFFYEKARPHLPVNWLKELKKFPPSLRKLEWNCKGETRDMWQHVLQFRPSGLRVKRYESAPALVAMTTTQVPILGRSRRFLSRQEALWLQGFPRTWKLPEAHGAAFQALGNGVHVDVVHEIVAALGLSSTRGTPAKGSVPLAPAVEGMPVLARRLKET